MPAEKLNNQPKMKYCIKCGTLIPEGARFCGNCGYNLTGEAVTTPQHQAVDKKPLKISEEKTVVKRRLRPHHVIFTALFGFVYAIPASILLFRNNEKAVVVLLSGAAIQTLIFYFWLAFN